MQVVPEVVLFSRGLLEPQQVCCPGLLRRTCLRAPRPRYAPTDNVPWVQALTVSSFGGERLGKPIVSFIQGVLNVLAAVTRFTGVFVGSSTQAVKIVTARFEHSTNSWQAAFCNAAASAVSVLAHNFSAFAGTELHSARIGTDQFWPGFGANMARCARMTLLPFLPWT